MCPRRMLKLPSSNSLDWDCAHFPLFATKCHGAPAYYAGLFFWISIQRIYISPRTSLGSTAALHREDHVTQDLWLVQRIFHALGSKMWTGNNAPYVGEGRKEECLLFSHTYANLEKSSGEMSAVKITVLTQNVFRYFTLCWAYRGKELLLFPHFKP